MLNRIDILTLFPDFVTSYLSSSILARAQQKQGLTLRAHNIRDFTENKHHQVDDIPYGGKMGMVIQMDPTLKAIESVKTSSSMTILLTPAGEKLSMPLCHELLQHDHLILLSGHYEGFDSRILHYVDKCVSIGDYVLTGGELPALSLTDSLVRLLPGVLGNDNSATSDSFYNGLLDWDVFTRPQKFDIFNVPDVLVSGHHQNIERWKTKSSLRNTWLNRPDLLARHPFSDEERNLLKQVFVEEDIE